MATQSHTLLPSKRISVIGYGSAGRAFTLALVRAGATISSIHDLPDSPAVERIREDGFTHATLDQTFYETDLLILAVPDRAIEHLAHSVAELSFAETSTGEPRIALHLSGAHGLAPLQPLADLGWQRIAFHPIQTFPPGSGAERFEGIYAGITADSGALPVALELAHGLGVQPMIVAEQDRVRYHLASVLVSNFLPLLLDLGADCLHGIAEDVASAEQALLPLMQGMLDSLHSHGSTGALTGPVARDDRETVIRHRDAGINDTTHDLYRHLTSALVDLAERSGRLSAEQADEWRKRMSIWKRTSC